jgi:hypothetical protein
MYGTVRYGTVWYGMDVCIYLQKIVEISMIIYESNYFVYSQAPFPWRCRPHKAKEE